MEAWSDEDSSFSSDDELQEIANLCLMVKEELKVNDPDYASYSSDDENENNSTFRVLCEKLLIDLQKSIEKYKGLKEEKSIEKYKGLKKENTAHKEKNHKFRKSPKGF